VADLNYSPEDHAQYWVHHPATQSCPAEVEYVGPDEVDVSVEVEDSMSLVAAGVPMPTCVSAFAAAIYASPLSTWEIIRAAHARQFGPIVLTGSVSVDDGGAVGCTHATVTVYDPGVDDWRAKGSGVMWCLDITESGIGALGWAIVEGLMVEAAQDMIDKDL